jgi:hypothetical protein
MYCVDTDCLGGKLILGERVLLAWLPRTKTGNGWAGQIVQGTLVECNSPTHPFAVKDDTGKITICSSSCILKQNSETFGVLLELKCL